MSALDIAIGLALETYCSDRFQHKIVQGIQHIVDSRQVQVKYKEVVDFIVNGGDGRWKRQLRCKNLKCPVYLFIGLKPERRTANTIVEWARRQYV